MIPASSLIISRFLSLETDRLMWEIEEYQNGSFGEHGEEQEQATGQVSRPMPGNFPTSLVQATGAKKALDSASRSLYT